MNSPTSALQTAAWRGPGLWGASLWMVVFLLSQVIASLIMLMLLAGSYMWNTETRTPEEMIEHLTQLASDPQHTLAFIGGTLLLSTGINSLLIWWRMGPRGRSSLGLSRLPLGQAMCVVLMVLPISTLGSKLYLIGESYWQQFVSLYPHAIDLRELESMSAIAGVAETTSWPWMIFLFALLPALSEELMFRGFIGRGLTERWGRVLGVGLTTCFFVTMHGYPPHMLALIPISIMLHDVYLVTKSFWAPVLLHFANNSLAVIALSMHSGSRSVDIQGADVIPPALLWASVSCILALAGLLRALQRRSDADVREIHAHGSSATGDDIPIAALLTARVDALKDSVGLMTRDRERFRRWFALATISVMLFGLAFRLT
ncbi:MAG: lysostaphin resistance A-like protein [Planctomycetaceae bacterium]